MSPLNTRSCIRWTIKFANLLALQLVTGPSLSAPEALGLRPGLGADGELTFIVQSGATHSSCTMDFSNETDNIVLESTSGCNGPFFRFRLNPRAGTITLLGGHTYHISSMALTTAFGTSNCNPFTMPVELRQFECDEAETTFSAASISPSSWTVTCTADGTCTTASSPITVTLP